MAKDCKEQKLKHSELGNYKKQEELTEGPVGWAKDKLRQTGANLTAKYGFGDQKASGRGAQALEAFYDDLKKQFNEWRARTKQPMTAQILRAWIGNKYPKHKKEIDKFLNTKYKEFFTPIR